MHDAAGRVTKRVLGEYGVQTQYIDRLAGGTWSRLPIAPAIQLSAPFGLPNGGALAVGAPAVVRYYDGGAWRTSWLNADGPWLRAVWAGDGVVYAVGERGVILMGHAP